MPRIDLITDDLYNAMDPYHVNYDNKPIQSLLKKIELVNSAVDNDGEILRLAAGTQGSLVARLNQFVDENGDLLIAAVDDVSHHIGAHTEGEYNGIEYVIMTLEERDKLELIADEATDLSIKFDTISSDITFDSGVVEFQASDTIVWSVTSPNKITATTTFPSTAAHNHHYNLIPSNANIITPDYTNFKSTSVSTPFVEGSLRVYINGFRIPEYPDSIYVPGSAGPSTTWKLTNFSPDATSGTFSLNRAIETGDVITIDFDTPYTA